MDKKNLYKEELEHLETKRKELPIFEPKKKPKKHHKPFKLTGIVKEITRDVESNNNKTYIQIIGIKPNIVIEVLAYNSIGYYFNKNYKIKDRIECMIKAKTYGLKTYYFVTYINSN